MILQMFYQVITGEIVSTRLTLDFFFVGMLEKMALKTFNGKHFKSTNCAQQWRDVLALVCIDHL